MLKRWITLGLVVAAVGAVAPVQAQQAQAPTLIVRIRSLEGLLADGKYIGALGGTDAESKVKELEGFIKATPLFDAIDPKQPIGLYGSLGSQPPFDSSAIVLLPVKSEKAVLDLLKGFNLEATKDKDDVYSVTMPNVPVPIYFRFANKYAYVTAANLAGLAKDKLLPPDKVLPASETSAVLSASLRIDQIDDRIKQQALGQLELRWATLLDELKDRVPNESAAQRKLREQSARYVFDLVNALIKDGGTLSIRVDVDRKKEEVSAELNVTGKDKSKLSASIADFGKTRCAFAGAVGGNSALSGIMHISLPDDVKKALDPALDELLQVGLAQEPDAAKRAEAEKLLKALMPSLKAGDIDGGFTLRGPGKGNLYAFVGGIQLKDGAGIEKVVRDAVNRLPDKDRALVKLDADNAGYVKIHRVELKDTSPQFKQSFGTHPAYVALRADAGFLAFGEDALPALKEALAAKPKDGPQMQLEMSLKRFARALEYENKGAIQAAETAFGKAADNDKLLVTLEGGKALKARVTVKAPVVKFFSLIQQSR